MDSMNTYELIEKYCLDLMDSKERHYFELEIERNPALKEAVHEYNLLITSLDHLQSKEFIHSSLDTLHRHSRSQTDIIINQLKLHVNKYWRTASVAASVAFIASTLTFVAARSVYKKDTHATYLSLRKEINNIKKDQTAIKKEVDNVKKSKVEVPNYPSKYSGTGFALTQSGYLVTNKHVIDGYEKIFAFTNDNIGHQCEVVASDEVNDIVILKINESGFAFESKVPYAVKKSKPNIAQRIYSLGYPKNDIVYNEGYISSTTGFEGDSSRFQLELPSGPGVSGSPILDEFGNIIGIVSGKQSETDGITYAIQSKSLLSLFKSLPKDFTSSEIASSKINGQTRAEQIKKIQPFVCVVKVYN